MAVQAILVPTAELTTRQRDEMFAVLDRYFYDMQRDVFERDLAEKPWTFLLTDGPDDTVHGFTTLIALAAEVQGQPVRAFFSGDTVLDRDYWASFVLEKCWLNFIFSEVAREPACRWYWFMICNSYRSFRFLPVYAKRYFPNPDEPTPAFEQAVMDALATQKFGAQYDPAQGTVRLTEGGGLRPGVGDITERELSDPRIAFFQTRNPQWHEGVELVTLTEITPSNAQPVVWRFCDETTRKALLAPA